MLETMFPDTSQHSQMSNSMYPEPVARIGRGRAMPPSKVLLVRSFDAPEHYLQRTLLPIAQTHDPTMTELPMFQQLEKGITFVQFPSIDCAAQAMEYINQGTMQTPNGKNIHSEFSSRAEVVSRRRPVPAPQTLSFNLPSAKRLCTTPIDNRDLSVPSPVLCVKTDMTGDELRTFMMQCPATVTDVLDLQNKNMIFMEFASIDDSTHALMFINSSGYVSRDGVQMDAMYSTRTKIERNDVRRPDIVEPSHCEFQNHSAIHPNAYSHFNQPANTDPIPHQGESHFNRPTNTDPTPHQSDSHFNQPTSTDPMPHQSELPPPGHGDLPSNRVVVVTLRSGMHAAPPTVDFLMRPFSHCGIVEKIIVFSTCAGECQALIQFATTSFAQCAMERYQGQVLGDFRVQINFSDRDDLDITQNSDSARDFTDPWLPEV